MESGLVFGCCVWGECMELARCRQLVPCLRRMVMVVVEREATVWAQFIVFWGLIILGGMLGRCRSNGLSSCSQWLHNVARAMRQTRGEEKYECGILKLEVIELSSVE